MIDIRNRLLLVLIVAVSVSQFRRRTTACGKGVMRSGVWSYLRGTRSSKLVTKLAWTKGSSGRAASRRRCEVQPSPRTLPHLWVGAEGLHRKDALIVGMECLGPPSQAAKALHAGSDKFNKFRTIPQDDESTRVVISAVASCASATDQRHPWPQRGRSHGWQKGETGSNGTHPKEGRMQRLHLAFGSAPRSPAAATRAGRGGRAGNAGQD
jgi:hypothetical protein